MRGAAIGVLGLLPAVASAAPAFEGAQGFGAEATGGRGGAVVKVTTLDATGPGSLQEALSTAGPRIVVFDVSGIIAADEILIPHGDLTIAGQTAPGAGITIDGRLVAAYEFGVDNIIVQHVRVRPTNPSGPGEQTDAIQMSRCANVLLDHVSVSFGVDETVDLFEATDVTVQWSTVESAATQGHPEGVHNYGLINGPNGARVSIHHNLFAHNQNRNPALATGPAEMRNNVVYNVRHGFVHHNPAAGSFSIVGNYFRAGGDDDLFPFFFDDENGGGARDLGYYLADNYVDDPGNYEGIVHNPWQEMVHPSFEFLGLDESYRVDADFDFGHTAVTTTAPQDAYDAVLQCAGAFPRDVVTLRSVQDTMDRTGTWGANVPPDLLDGLVAGKPPPDEDGDGMPDAWERRRGLDPGDASDAALVLHGEQTAVEVYLAERADELVGSACAVLGDDDDDDDDDGDTGPGGDDDDADDDADPGDDDDDDDDDDDNGPDAGEDDDASASAGADETGTGGGPGADEDEGGGCGCSHEPHPAHWLLMPALLLLRRRRSRARAGH